MHPQNVSISKMEIVNCEITLEFPQILIKGSVMSTKKQPFNNFNDLSNITSNFIIFVMELVNSEFLDEF